MPTTYDALIACRAEGLRFSYGDRETMLYALSLGMGEEPAELPFVFEGGGGLTAVPTQACVVARSNLLADAGLDRTRLVHGEQRVELHRPLPPAADLVAASWVDAIHDKGPGRGALIVVATDIRLSSASQEPLCTLYSTVFARGDGGIGGPMTPAAPPHPLPQRAPDHVFVGQTTPQQALLYRLNGDRNPLHADPAFAARAGFKGPILHGLCTYGMACRAVLATACSYQADAVAAYAARFTSPVYPGERLRTEVWVDSGQVSFRCHVEDRDVVALDHGLCILR